MNLGWSPWWSVHKLFWHAANTSNLPLPNTSFWSLYFKNLSLLLLFNTNHAAALEIMKSNIAASRTVKYQTRYVINVLLRSNLLFVLFDHNDGNTMYCFYFAKFRAHWKQRRGSLFGHGHLEMHLHGISCCLFWFDLVTSDSSRHHALSHTWAAVLTRVYSMTINKTCYWNTIHKKHPMLRHDTQKIDAKYWKTTATDIALCSNQGSQIHEMKTCFFLNIPNT